MELRKITDIKLNPNNPRLIKDDKFKKLVQSIKDFPEMLDIRPIVVNKDMIILGANMRYRACKEAGIKEIPVIVTDLSEDKQREFLIKDNVSGGEWDWDIIANEWDADELEAWGLDLPVFDIEPEGEDLIGEDKNNPAIIKITFESVEQLQKAEIDIRELIDRKYNGAYFSISAGEI
jgi:hypothetical protein